jgi:hypothetical protein
MGVRQLDKMYGGDLGATIARAKLDIKDELDAERKEMEAEGQR